MKKVRFAESKELSTVLCEVVARSELSEKDFENTWFDTAEFDKLKAQAKLIARELRRQGRGRLLVGAFGELSKEFHESDSFTKEVQAMLVKWSLHGPSSRGLEKWVNSDQGKLRRQLQRRVIQVVLHVQEQESQRAVPPGELAEKIRQVSEENTAKARLFGRMMGIADAAASSLQQMTSCRLPMRYSIDASTSLFEVIPEGPSSRCSPMA